MTTDPPLATDAQLREQKLTVAEVARILRVHKMTVYRAIDSGDLRAYRVSPRVIRVPIAAVREFLAAAEPPITPASAHAAPTPQRRTA